MRNMVPLSLRYDKTVIFTVLREFDEIEYDISDDIMYRCRYSMTQSITIVGVKCHTTWLKGVRGHWSRLFGPLNAIH